MTGHLGWASDVARMFPANDPVSSGAVRISRIDNLLAADNDPADQFNSALELSAASFPFRFDMAIQGFEAAGSAPGETILLAGRAAELADHWTPTLDAGLYAGMTPRPLAGSDILVLRFFGQDSVLVRFDKDTNSITYVTASDIGFMRPMRFYGIANYGAAAIFQAPAVLSGATVTVEAGVGSANQQLFQAASEALRGLVMLYPVNIFAYYVGLGASGAPSLFRAVFNGSSWTSEELVEGVEMLQLTYGLDVGTAGSPDGSVDTYLTAAAMAAGLTSEVELAARWRSVGAVRVGMLIRSSERAGTPDRDEADPDIGNIMIGRSVIDLPEGDAFLRRPYETTVALRNRALGN